MSRCNSCGQHAHVVCGTCGGAAHANAACYCGRTHVKRDGAMVVVSYRGKGPRIAQAVSA